MAHHVGMSFVALTNAARRQMCGRVVFTPSLWCARRSCCFMSGFRAGSCFTTRRDRRPDDALPDSSLERPVVREIDTRIRPTARRAAWSAPVHDHDHPCRRRIQPARAASPSRDGARRHGRHTGQFCYVKDVVTATCGPRRTSQCAPRGSGTTIAYLATDRVTFHRRDHGIETRTEIVVVPDDSAEVRRVTFINETTRHGRSRSRATARSSSPFPAPTDSTRRSRTCLCKPNGTSGVRRSPRRAGHGPRPKRPLWCVHVVDPVVANASAPVTCETDRARFLGRGRSPRDPLAAPRRMARSRAPPVPCWTRSSRFGRGCDSAGSIGDGRLHDARHRRRGTGVRAGRPVSRPNTAQRALDLAWTSAQVELRELGALPADAASVFQELAGHLFSPTPILRAPVAETAPRTPTCSRSCRSQRSPAIGRSCSRRHSPSATACRPSSSSSPRITTGDAAA